MKIAVLGGSFDPPHLGHLLIAQQVKEIVGVDQVWFMPLYKQDFNKFFEKNLSDFKHRFNMAKLLENSYIKASDFEKEYNPTSRTIDSLNLLSKKFPNDKFYWIQGTDQMLNFQKYIRWEEILKKHNLIIFPREYILPKLEEEVKEVLALKEIPENVIILNSDQLVLTNVSSTKVRKRVKANLSIENMVRPEIEKYIVKNKLYV